MDITITRYLPYCGEKINPVHCEGEKLVVGESVYDFGPLPEGATLPPNAHRCPYIVGDVTREKGVVRIHLHIPEEVNGD